MAEQVLNTVMLPVYEYELLKRYYRAGVAARTQLESLQKADELKLMAGEMTGRELRLAKAIALGIKARIDALYGDL